MYISTIWSSIPSMVFIKMHCPYVTLSQNDEIYVKKILDSFVFP